MKIFIKHLQILVLPLFVFLPLFADNINVSPEGNKLLKEIDSNLLPESTVFYRKLINIEPNGAKKEFVLFSAKKGKDKILSTFLEPKTEAGRHTLRVGDNMWLYVPNVGKPLRITSLQSVTGGLFNNSDIMRLDFSEEYNCIELDQKDKKLILKAKTKSVAYDKLVMIYDPKYKVPTVIECFTASNMLVKTLRFMKIKDFGSNIIRPEVIETDSPLYKGYKSVMIYANVKRKQIPDEVFTVNSMSQILKLR